MDFYKLSEMSLCVQRSGENGVYTCHQCDIAKLLGFQYRPTGQCVWGRPR